MIAMMREELSWNNPCSIATLSWERAIAQRRSLIGSIGKGWGSGMECCIARVRKYVPWYHRCLYVQGYEQTRAAMYSKLPFMKLNFMVCGIRLYPACWILPVTELFCHYSSLLLILDWDWSILHWSRQLPTLITSDRMLD